MNNKKEEKRSKSHLCRGLSKIFLKHRTKVADTGITTKFANFCDSVFMRLE